MLLTPADARRRSYGLLCLVLAVVLLIWGRTLLQPHLNGIAFILYWLACLGIIVLTMGIALWDIWVMRRRWRRQQDELVKRTLMEIELKKRQDQPPAPPPDQGG